MEVDRPKPPVLIGLLLAPLAGSAAALVVWLVLTEALGFDDPVSEDGPWVLALVLPAVVVARTSRRREVPPAVTATLVVACVAMTLVFTFVLVVGVLALLGSGDL